ncbi:MAG: hypothetical protein WC831_04580 [Parcubacteria group bacterium]|jgi:hypothetical protein
MKKTKGVIFCALVIFLFFFIGKASADGVLLPDVGLPSKGLPDIIEGLVKWLLGVFGFLAILSFIISGAMYFFSAGDDAAMKKAKNQMKWSIIGVVVGLMGYVAIAAVDSALRGNGLG